MQCLLSLQVHVPTYMYVIRNSIASSYKMSHMLDVVPAEGHVVSKYVLLWNCKVMTYVTLEMIINRPCYGLNLFSFRHPQYNTVAIFQSLLCQVSTSSLITTLNKERRGAVLALPRRRYIHIPRQTAFKLGGPEPISRSSDILWRSA